MAKDVGADEMTNEFAEFRRWYRDVEYVMVELPMDEYDKTVKQATATKTVNGVEEEEFDNTLHTKILTARSLVSPKLTAEQLYKRGTRLVRALQGDVLKLHLDPEPETKKDGDDGEGEVTSSASA